MSAGTMGEGQKKKKREGLLAPSRKRNAVARGIKQPLERGYTPKPGQPEGGGKKGKSPQRVIRQERREGEHKFPTTLQYGPRSEGGGIKTARKSHALEKSASLLYPRRNPRSRRRGTGGKEKTTCRDDATWMPPPGKTTKKKTHRGERRQSV